MSKAVGVVHPAQMNFWWEVISYFTLSTVSIFVLSHVLFGTGGVIFLFARGMHDNSLILYLESTISGWSISKIPMSEIYMVLIVVLILTVNLPICLWSGQLGIQRSIYTLNRIREKPVNPDFGKKPLSNLLIAISASLITGLISALLFTYI